MYDCCPDQHIKLVLRYLTVSIGRENVFKIIIANLSLNTNTFDKGMGLLDFGAAKKW